MSDDDNRYSALVNKLEQSVEVQKKRPTSRRKSGPIEPNPPKGEKGNFVRLSVMLSPEVYTLLAFELTRRRTAKEGNLTASAIIREALVAMLQKTE